MSNELARTHTNVSKRSKGQANAEKKEVFKTVLDNPFHIEWYIQCLLSILNSTHLCRPSVHLDVQRHILADLLSILKCISDHLDIQGRTKRTEKKRRRKRSDLDSGDDDMTGTVDPSTTRQLGIGQESPPILQHITVGINEVTKSLERQAKYSRHKLTVSDKGPASHASVKPLIKFVFVCRADIDPPLLVAHLPHLVAACNSCVHDQGSSRESSDVVKMVPLPKGAELSLAEAVGFRRAAVLALDVSCEYDLSIPLTEFEL